MLSGNAVGKRASYDPQSNSGAAMAATGTTLSGVGLIAGGVPGVKEPDANRVWLLRGSTKKQRAAVRNKQAFPHPDPRGNKSPVHPRNAGHNVRQAAGLPRAGILGFRAKIHDEFIRENQGKRGGDAYVRGNRAGKLEAEEKIVRGMRTARRATYPVTLGGAALALAGSRKMKQNGVEKRESSRERGAVAGTAGATAGGAVGLYGGVKYGAEAGVKVVNRNIRRAYEKEHGVRLTGRQTVVGGNTFVRRLNGLSRGLKGGAAIGTSVAGTAGYRLARGEKVDKRDRVENASAAALAGGGTVAGIGHAVPKGLNRFSRKYSNSAKQHVLAAQRLHPGMGGLETLPAKTDPVFGGVTKPAKSTMYPEKSDAELRRTREADKIRPAAVREQVGRHRGVAAQERHFAEVFDSTSRAVRRVRGPGLALAGAGATGLLASRDVRKAVYGVQERHTSRRRQAEFLAGGALAAYGLSRHRMLGPLTAYGARVAEKQGAKPEQVEAVMSAARAVTRGVRDKTGQGEAYLRRVKALDDAIDAVPVGLRPVVATTAGVMLVNHARPVTRERFVPQGRY